MTRGTLFLITDSEVLESIDFNGDMYPEGHGDEVMINLRNVNSKEDFEKMVKKFNDKNFNYDEKLVYQKSWYVNSKEEKKTVGLFESNNVIDFDNDYFERFFSDYIFIKNISKKNFSFRDREESLDTIKSGDTIRLYFGRLFEESRHTLSEVSGD
jgi:hypothetical protein